MHSDTTTIVNLSDAISNYIAFLEITRNPSPRTIINYVHWLKRFFGWAGERIVNDLTLDDVEKYRFFLYGLKKATGEKLLSIKTLNHHLGALRVLFQYCISHGIKAPMPELIKAGKVQKRSVECLSRDEFQKLYDAIQGKGIRVVRNRAIIYLFFSTGLRVSELSSLNREDIDLTRQEFTIIGKGRKPGIVFLKEFASNALREYLSKRTDDFPSLFINYKSYRSNQNNPAKRRMHPAAIQRLVKSLAKKAGIQKHVTPHILRHTFATQLIINGADIVYVKEMMRHESINTTMVYTHVSNSRLREIHDRFLN